MSEYESDAMMDADEPERLGPPWEDADQDFFGRAWQTIVGVVSNPVEFFEALRREGGIMQPFLFYLLLSWPALVLGALLQAPFDMMISGGGGETLITVLVLLFLGPVFLFIGLIIGSGLTHLGLMVFGWANHPYESTFRVNAYAFGGVAWLNVIPFCGGMIAGIWGIVLEIIGIARVQGITTGQAAAAVLIPLAVVIVLMICVFAVFFGAIAAMFM